MKTKQHTNSGSFYSFIWNLLSSINQNFGKILVMCLAAQIAVVNGQRGGSPLIRPTPRSDLDRFDTTGETGRRHDRMHDAARGLKNADARANPSDTRFEDFTRNNRHIPSPSERQRDRQTMDRLRGVDPATRPCEVPADDRPSIGPGMRP